MAGKMLSRHSMKALTLSERQTLLHHARRRGQCVRCFHASMQRTADHQVSGKGASQEESDKGSPKANLVENVQARPKPPESFDSASPHQPTKPASQQDRRRHQRSAMISEEVQMIQRDHPSPTFTADNPNATTTRPPPTAQTTNPEGSAMGANDPVSREGPTGQGIGKAVTTEEDVQDSSKMARGARSPHEGVEEPAEGGIAVVGTPDAGRRTVRLAEEDDVEEGEEAEEEAPMQTRVRTLAPEVQEPSSSLSKEDLLYKGYETSTIAGGALKSTLEDHFRLVAHPGEQIIAERDTRQLALNLLAGRLVHFRSKEEKAVTEELLRMRTMSKKAKFSPVPQNVQQNIVDRLAKGVYDPEGLLQGKPKYKNQPLLDQLAQQAMKNSTYMPGDGDRFLRKVQSLLPRAEPQVQKGGRPQQQQARVK